MITLPTATGLSYRNNMAALRQAVLQERATASGGLSTLRVHVLSPYSEDVYVDCILLLSNLYLVAIENRHGVFCFPDHPFGKTHGQQKILGFGGGYTDLGRYRDLDPDDREGLSIGAVNSAISHVSKWTTSTTITNRTKDQRGSHKGTPDAKSLLDSGAHRFRSASISRYLEDRRECA